VALTVKGTTSAYITNLAPDHVEVTATPGATGGEVLFNYILPSAYTTLLVPQTVVYTQGSQPAVYIQQAAYQTSSSLFSSCSAPCIYQNSANRTLILAGAPGASYIVDFYFPSVTSGSNGNSGNSGNSGNGGNTQTQTQSSTQSYTTVSSTVTSVVTSSSNSGSSPPVTYPGEGVIPYGPLLAVVAGGSALFAIVILSGYRQKAGEDLSRDLSFAGRSIGRDLNFNAPLHSDARSGPQFRRKKKQ
jgi:hypothetical protein